MKFVKLFLLLFLTTTVYSQKDTTAHKFSDYVKISGYVKNMQIASFAKNLDSITNDNLIHNRLILKFLPTKNIFGKIEIRNRIFFGESVDAFPNYSELVDIDNGFVDLSWAIVDKSSLVLLTQVDRAWVDWSNEKWEIRLGRQRINWGTNLFWNSNDLFNAYSLVDFDYEERPGTDALRIQRFFENMSAFEIAIKPGKNEKDWVGAALFKFNKWQYDFQFLTGWWYEDFVVGTGWAGNLGKAGFKGETSLFIPTNEEKIALSTSLSVDYVFSNQLFLTGGFLFSSTGVDSIFQNQENLFTAPLSAKNLLPMKYSGIISVNYPFNPIFSGGVTAIYSPGVNAAFLMTSINYSIADNWEISLFTQSFWMQAQQFENIGNGVYLRIKVNF